MQGRLWKALKLRLDLGGFGGDVLGGSGDFVSRLIMGINGISIWVIRVTYLLPKSP